MLRKSLLRFFNTFYFAMLETFRIFALLNKTTKYMATIQSIDNELAEIGVRIAKLHAEKNKIILKEINWVGKYIFCQNIGCMYVTAVYVDSNAITFQGIGLRSSFSPYSDDYSIFLSLLDNFSLSASMYQSRLEKGELKEITRDEFLEKYNDIKEEINIRTLGRIDSIINSKLFKEK